MERRREGETERGGKGEKERGRKEVRDCVSEGERERKKSRFRRFGGGASDALLIFIFQP